MTLAPLDMAAAAKRAIDAKTKPVASLGRLEEIAVRLATVQNTPTPAIRRARVCVFAADHGVADAGVSAYPKSVTAEMMKNFDAGGAAINVLARANAIEVETIDVGVDADLLMLGRVRHEKVRSGSHNFLERAAMTAVELSAAMQVGARAVRRALDDEVRALGLGEMGIGNTTSAAALLAAYTGRSANETVGRGTGVSPDGLANKRAAVERALALHREPGARSAREGLRRLGGLEIAAIAGATIAAARTPIALVGDGFISTVGILAGLRILAGEAADALDALRPAVFIAHRSTEFGHAIAIEAVGAALRADARPLLELDLRLGEGTGAALAIPLLRSAASVLCEMATFASAEISAGEHRREHSVESFGDTHRAAAGPAS
jgi:nicotinate-nucleotide--dimethylbenzimidazole phosphoribosyltransferase